MPTGCRRGNRPIPMGAAPAFDMNTGGGFIRRPAGNMEAEDTLSRAWARQEGDLARLGNSWAHTVERAKKAPMANRKNQGTRFTWLL